MKYYHKFCNILQKILGIAVAVFISAMLILMLVEVFRRYLLGITWIWSDEIIRICLIYTAFLGGAVALGVDNMIKFDLVYDAIKGRKKDILDFAILIVSTIFLAIVFCLSIMKLMSPAMLSQVSPNTGMPILITYICVPVSIGSCILFCIDRFPEKGKYLFGKRSDSAEEVEA